MQIEALKAAGVTEVVLAINYQPEVYIRFRLCCVRFRLCCAFKQTEITDAF